MGKRSSLLSRRKELEFPLRGRITRLVEEHLRNEKQKRNVPSLYSAYFCKPSVTVVSKTESPRNTEKRGSRFVLVNESMESLTNKRRMETERETKVSRYRIKIA